MITAAWKKAGTRGLLCGFVCQGEWVIGIIRSIRIQFPKVKFFGFVSKRKLSLRHDLTQHRKNTPGPDIVRLDRQKALS